MRPPFVAFELPTYYLPYSHASLILKGLITYEIVEGLIKIVSLCLTLRPKIGANIREYTILANYDRVQETETKSLFYVANGNKTAKLFLIVRSANRICRLTFITFFSELSLVPLWKYVV